MIRKISIAAAFLCVPTFSALAAPSVSEGKVLYEQFRCADCHGADGKNASQQDAKTGSVTKVPLLAGMNPDEIYSKTKRFVESRSHEQVLQGCGEPPSHAQIKKISDYLATLPR